MQAKEFLSRQQMSFVEIDITQLEDPWTTLREITGGPIATPVVVIGDEFLLGFDPQWIEERLSQ